MIHDVATVMMTVDGLRLSGQLRIIGIVIFLIHLCDNRSTYCEARIINRNYTERVLERGSTTKNIFYDDTNKEAKRRALENALLYSGSLECFETLVNTA